MCLWACALSKDSHQPANGHSLVGVYGVRIIHLFVFSYELNKSERARVSLHYRSLKRRCFAKTPLFYPQDSLIASGEAFWHNSFPNPTKPSFQNLFLNHPVVPANMASHLLHFTCEFPNKPSRDILF